jgi:hypothetical protein
MYSSLLVQADKRPCRHPFTLIVALSPTVAINLTAVKDQGLQIGKIANSRGAVPLYRSC